MAPQLLAPSLPHRQQHPWFARIRAVWAGGPACSSALALFTPLQLAWQVAADRAFDGPSQAFDGMNMTLYVGNRLNPGYCLGSSPRPPRPRVAPPVHALASPSLTLAGSSGTPLSSRTRCCPKAGKTRLAGDSASRARPTGKTPRTAL